MTQVTRMQDLQFTKLTSMIGKRGMQVHALIQTAAVQAVLCSIEDRHPQRANQLLASINIGQRKDSLVMYLERFGNLAWLKSEKKFGFFDAKREWTPDYANTVAAFDWAKAKKEPQITSVYDVNDMLDKLVDAAQRAVKQGKQIVGSDTLTALEAICFKVRGAKYEEAAEHLLSGEHRDPLSGDRGVGAIPMPQLMQMLQQ